MKNIQKETKDKEKQKKGIHNFKGKKGKELAKMIFESETEDDEDISLTEKEKDRLKEFNEQWLKKLKIKVKAEGTKLKREILQNIIDNYDNYQRGTNKKLDAIIDELDQTFKGNYRIACSGFKNLSEQDKENILKDIRLLQIIDKYFEDDAD